MQVISLICEGLDALEDKLTEEAFDVEREVRDEEDKETKARLHESIGYLRGKRDAYQAV